MKFSERLLALGFGSYADYLASEHWAGFRRQYKTAGLRMTCLVCSGKPIQLHHRTYARLGNERLDDVIPVCRPHHVAVHDWLKASGKKFVEYTHEAVAALGGECPAPVKRAAQGRALGLQKRDERRAKKKARRAAKFAIAGQALRESPLPEIAALQQQFAAFQLTTNQKAAIARFVAAGDAKQLRGFLKSVLNCQEARGRAKVKNKKHRAKKHRVQRLNQTPAQSSAHSAAKRAASLAISQFRKLKGIDRVNALADAVKRARETPNNGSC